jgi:separase
MPIAKPAPSQRRAPTRTNGITGKKQAVISPDDLADRLATTLVISNAIGKRKATASTAPPAGHSIDAEECRFAAMRAVNGGLQSLAAVVQSGWKRLAEGGESSLGKKGTTLSDVQASSTSISTSLRKLRGLGSGDLDVERAASSFVGKLVSLEMVRASGALPICCQYALNMWWVV